MYTHESNFDEITRHYIHSALATSVLLALARCRRDHAFKSEDAAVLRQAESFFRKLEEGEAFQRGESLTLRALQSGISFEETLPALTNHEPIGKYLTQLRDFIPALLERPNICETDSRFAGLQQFMKRFGELQSNLIVEGTSRRGRIESVESV